MLTSLTSWCTVTATSDRYLQHLLPIPYHEEAVSAGTMEQVARVLSFNLMLSISQMLGASVAHPLPRGGRQRRDMEEYIGIERTSSAWRAEVLTVIRILHKIAGEPSLSPAMMLVLEVVNPEHHLYTL